ncbi:unnamed protein product [Eruca vesicaria subsp. sativa]|uniref:Uncharacterized protein n=1 Tax=Eruca vesicaria subsp. sativa TaxID=29727 RepID=A0ABC8M2R6_ERUVS|nr:unnamed protein product [Eruca vesicaria subsp. sativa]
MSTEECENHLKWEKTEKCRQVLEAIAASIEEPTRRRKPQWTKTQVISGVTVSKKAASQD